MDPPSRNLVTARSSLAVPSRATRASAGCSQPEEAACPAAGRRHSVSLWLQVPERVTQGAARWEAGSHHGKGGGG